MRENYQTPSIEVIEIEIGDAILQDSVTQSNNIEVLKPVKVIGDF